MFKKILLFIFIFIISGVNSFADEELLNLSNEKINYISSNVKVLLESKNYIENNTKGEEYISKIDKIIPRLDYSSLNNLLEKIQLIDIDYSEINLTTELIKYLLVKVNIEVFKINYPSYFENIDFDNLDFTIENTFSELPFSITNISGDLTEIIYEDRVTLRGEVLSDKISNVSINNYVLSSFDGMEGDGRRWGYRASINSGSLINGINIYEVKYYDFYGNVVYSHNIVIEKK